MLPNAIAAVAMLFGLQAHGRVAAMLNYTLGAKSLSPLPSRADSPHLHLGAVRRRREARAPRRQVARGGDRRLPRGPARAHHAVAQDQGGCREPFRRPVLLAHARRARRDRRSCLFTSGSEGMPKGVALSHANVLANREQVAARIDFSSQDVILNALPLFHSFGLTAGTLLPLLSGMRTFFYPSPLHYRIVPEIAYDVNATIMFGTNTFLAGYARFAHPYDFYSVRYVFAGAEKLKDETRRSLDRQVRRAGLRGLRRDRDEPRARDQHADRLALGTVGRFLPGIEYALDPVPGVEGGRLSVRGPERHARLPEARPSRASFSRRRRNAARAGTTRATSSRSTPTASSRSKAARSVSRRSAARWCRWRPSRSLRRARGRRRSTRA